MGWTDLLRGALLPDVLLPALTLPARLKQTIPDILSPSLRSKLCSLITMWPTLEWMYGCHTQSYSHELSKILSCIIRLRLAEGKHFSRRRGAIILIATLKLPCMYYDRSLYDQVHFNSNSTALILIPLQPLANSKHSLRIHSRKKSHIRSSTGIRPTRAGSNLIAGNTTIWLICSDIRIQK